MEPIDEHQIVQNILVRAQNRDYTKVHLLEYFEEYGRYRMELRTTQLVLRILRDSANKLFKTYCKQIPSGAADINVLLAFVQLQEVIEFYETDLKIIQQMLEEYEDYLRHGNLFSALLGEKRYR